MDLSKLHRGEFVAMLGGAMLLIAIFLKKTYEARPENPNANIDGLKGTISIWQAHGLMRFLLVAAAAAPFILAWVIVRDHQLSWPRGQVTAIVSIAVIGLLFYTGIVDRPGEPSGEIELDYAWYVAMGGAFLMLGGSFLRSEESAAVRKPPGVL